MRVNTSGDASRPHVRRNRAVSSQHAEEIFLQDKGCDRPEMEAAFGKTMSESEGSLMHDGPCRSFVCGTQLNDENAGRFPHEIHRDG